MLTSLLSTKLSIPTPRSRLVERPHLISRLNSDLWGGNGFARKLTLVSAPAGYGKTTLVTAWLAALPSISSTDRGERGEEVKVAWLSLEESDNDPVRFTTYLIAALGQVQPGFGEQVNAQLASPQPLPSEFILATLVNELATVRDPIILALDDYHVIHTPPIHEQVSFILEHQPPRIHLVIMTREDPLLPVARLRAQGQVCDVRQDDLRFTNAETADFLGSVMGLALSSEDVAALERRTEGWIAGLQLAALSMRGRSDMASFIRAFTGSSRFVLEYLIEQVFARQTTQIQDFLLKTSILERLCAPLCDAVAEQRGSQALLEALESANLFIVPLDQSRTWYRYHRLFAELLRYRLRVSNPGSEPEYHRRASLWFETEGLIAEAIQHTLAAQDWERAANLIGRAADGLLKRGELVTLIDWYQKIPEGLIRSQPASGMSYAWALLLQGRFDEAEKYLAYFEEIGQAMPVLLGQVTAAQAYAARARGDNQRVIERSELALGLLPESDIASRSILSLNLGLVYWHEGRLREAVPALNDAQALALQTDNHYAGLTAQIFLARTLASQGALRQAEERLQKTLQVGGKIPILVLAHYDLCCIYYEWNELGRAWEHLNTGLEMCIRSGNVEFQNGGHMLKARLLMAQGNLLAALAEAERSHALSAGFSPATQARSMACHAQIALAMGDRRSARQWVEQMPADVDAHSFYRFLGLIQPRLLLAEGRKSEAIRGLAPCYEKARAAGWGYAMIAIRTLQALAAESQETSIEFLADALQLARPERYIRTFVDAGTSLVPLLQEAARRGTLPGYIGQILEAFNVRYEKFASLPLVEPLSGREIEVLRLVTAGLSNREIAEKLYISPGTAKTHIHNICGKLGARNRTEAATLAKELGLV